MKLQVLFGIVLALFTVYASGGKTEVESCWGEAVEGVQCRLFADKVVWEASDIPALKLDVRN